MDVKELFTLFRNHTHTGAYPDAKRLPAFALPPAAFTPAICLLSPNGSRFILSVDNDGAITTQPSVASNVLVSPDGSRFNLGVDSDGAPTTQKSNTRFVSYQFLSYVTLVDSVGNQFLLKVDDNGVLYTESVP